MNSQARWQEQAGQTTLRCGPFTAELQDDSLGKLTWNDSPLPGSLHRVKTPAGSLPAASETYIRGADRCSTHPATDAFPFRTQLFWSAEAGEDDSVRVTLTVSLQTDLLDTRPELTFATELAETARVESWRGEALRFDVADTPTLLLTPHPSDAIECEPRLDDRSGTLRLSPPFLEKGVIRRCRVAAIWLPGDIDDTRIAEAIEHFGKTPLPLTT